MYLELMNRFDFGKKFNNLHPIEEMEIEFDPDQDKIDIQELVVNEQDLRQQLSQPDLAEIPKATREQYQVRQSLLEEIDELRITIGKANRMIMSTELISMKRVMRRLELIDKNDVPQLKGKVAASVSAADELLTTELIFSGFFGQLDPLQMAAVLSCLVYTDSKSEGKPPKDEVLSRPFENLMEVCEKVAGVMVESNIELDKQEY